MSLEKNFVVKTGTRVLTHEGFNAHEPDQMDMNVMHQLARDISSISKETEMGAVLVTSGAVGFGDAKKDLKRHTKNPDELVKIKQALAAYGQTRLMNQWGNAFHEAKPSRDVAQFLITHNNLTNPSERDDMLRTMGIVLEQGDVPVVNENDTVANREIRFGDNDQLASQLALSTGAEALIILSEVEGFCDKDPR